MQVKSKLKGHSKRITGLAFSHLLNVLVSSGADAQVICLCNVVSSVDCLLLYGFIIQICSNVILWPIALLSEDL